MVDLVDLNTAPLETKLRTARDCLGTARREEHTAVTLALNSRAGPSPAVRMLQGLRWEEGGTGAQEVYFTANIYTFV